MTYEVIPKEVFDAMSNVEKRMLVARDALKQICSRQLIARSGYYLRITDDTDHKKTLDDLTYETPTHDPQAVECLTNGTCEVCAKGAIFIASILRTNNMLTGTMSGMQGSGMTSHIANRLGIFDSSELDDMEATFEGSTDVSMTQVERASDPRASALVDAYETYYKRFHDDTERLTAILLNVVNNGGFFHPEVEVTKQEVHAEMEKYKAPLDLPESKK